MDTPVQQSPVTLKIKTKRANVIKTEEEKELKREQVRRRNALATVNYAKHMAPKIANQKKTVEDLTDVIIQQEKDLKEGKLKKEIIVNKLRLKCETRELNMMTNSAHKSYLRTQSKS
ncbi:Hypothetical predicted protein [Mytilus galloprovincialis]|uniref:Uncharacterized protein n=1 Tax=Mytilus galloprovincialis TaxID=29158 RepID=A0A8B6BJY4_MYTGA|nr:Hypothetical predicted protein [Mytilus galloprovincialis]